VTSTRLFGLRVADFFLRTADQFAASYCGYRQVRRESFTERRCGGNPGNSGDIGYELGGERVVRFAGLRVLRGCYRSLAVGQGLKGGANSMPSMQERLALFRNACTR